MVKLSGFIIDGVPVFEEEDKITEGVFFAFNIEDLLEEVRRKRPVTCEKEK